MNTAWAPDRLVHRADLATVMLRAAAGALDGSGLPDLGRPEPRRSWWRRARPVPPAIPLSRVADVRADEVASWMVGAYPDRRYPAVVIGSPHAGALHLAAAMGAPWLPAGFRVSAQNGDRDVRHPRAALHTGRPVAAQLLDGEPDVAVYQRCEPFDYGSTLDFYLKWTALPAAVRRFLADRLTADATVLLVRDCRDWPAVRLDDGYSFAVGSTGSGMAWPDYCRQLRETDRDLGEAAWAVPSPPESGLDAELGVHPGLLSDLRQWSCHDGGRRLRVVATTDPCALSAAVADIYRSWLRGAGKTGNRLVVGCGVLLDPWHVLRAGLVPYWSAQPARDDVEALEYWLAGSEPFRSVDVLVEPPARISPHFVPRTRLSALGRFGVDHGLVDPTCLRQYPLGALDAGYATKVLRGQPYDLPVPKSLAPDVAVEGLDRIARYGRPLIT
jgi:hypothetical protein